MDKVLEIEGWFEAYDEARDWLIANDREFVYYDPAAVYRRVRDTNEDYPYIVDIARDMLEDDDD